MNEKKLRKIIRQEIARRERMRDAELGDLLLEAFPEGYAFAEIEAERSDNGES